MDYDRCRLGDAGVLIDLGDPLSVFDGRGKVNKLCFYG